MSTSTPTVSKQCAQQLHGFCKNDRVTCACTACHLGPCDACGATNLQRVFVDNGTTRCAGCERTRAKLHQTGDTACDTCGKNGAFRNPGSRRNEYLCSDCHTASGESVVLTSSVAHLAQPCKGKNIDDPSHAWVHIRGSRFQCLCGTKKYDDALRRETTRTLERELFDHD